MFGWLPGLPGSVFTDRNELGNDRTRVFNLADVNFERKRNNAKWAVEMHDGSRSYYVSYRACTGYDINAKSDWCGAIQVSYRDNGKVTATHLGLLKTKGQQLTFGSSNRFTVTSPLNVPRSRPLLGTVKIIVRIYRGPGAAPRAPIPRPWPNKKTRDRCRQIGNNEGACRRDSACRWKRWRKACAPKLW